MKIHMHAALGVALALAIAPVALAAERPVSSDGTDPKTWDPKLDGPIAAPANHQVVFENDNVRIMVVTVRPGETEAHHLHLKCSVLVFDQPTRVADRDAKGQALGAVVWGAIPWLGAGAPKNAPFVWVQPPEALHSITNNDTRAMHLTRIEMKKGCDAPPP